MFSYNHAQRAVAGGKYSCRKAATPVCKKASSALDFISNASKALALPSVPFPVIAGRRIRTCPVGTTCEDLFWALSIVLVAWLLQQAIEATNSNQALKASLLAAKSCQVQLSSPTPQECPQQPLQESGEDGSSSSQGQQEAAGAKPAAASTSTVALIYVDAGCSSQRSSDSAADTAFLVEQAQLAEQDETAADAQCCTSRQQQQRPAAAAKGKLQVHAADSDILQQQEACAVQPGSLPVAAAAAAVVVQQQAAVVKLSWLQRALTKLLGSCGGHDKMAVVSA